MTVSLGQFTVLAELCLLQVLWWSPSLHMVYIIGIVTALPSQGWSEVK